MFKLKKNASESLNIESQGLGIGLYVTKKIVLAFEGTVYVESVLGVGSTFSLTFSYKIPD